MLIKAFANGGGDPFIKFDCGGSDMIVGNLYGGTTNNKLVLGPGGAASSVAGGISIDGSGKVGVNIASGNPFSKFEVRSNGAAGSLAGGAFIRSGVDWDSVGTTHVITYPNYAQGDNSTGMILVHAKSPTNNKVGTMLILWHKRSGTGVGISQINAFASGMSTFSSQVGSNIDNIQINTDSDVAICWQAYGAQ